MGPGGAHARFAASVLREDIFQSIEELEVDMTEHIQFVIDALKEKADVLGLKGSIETA